MTIYLFDMDGTLTPPRLPMAEAFARKFLAWQKTHLSFIATGSDYKKVQEQLSQEVINAFTGIYCSMGNLLIANGNEVYRNEFTIPPELLAQLETFRATTKYPGKIYPNYIEKRVGMVNFSVLGRDCPYSARLEYGQWDSVNHERLSIQKVLQTAYPGLEISVGGSISIDITPKCCGKGQIAHRLREKYPTEKIVFFGDRTFPGGNDFELAEELMKFQNTRTFQVAGPDEVLSRLEELSTRA